MKRKIIEIDESRCNGCGLCADACHEGAIGMVGGKAKLLRDDYCDGLGDCLPTCPTGAIRFVEREADAYDEEAARRRLSGLRGEPDAPGPGLGQSPCPETSMLRQWPVQIKLVPVSAPYFDGAGLLVAADCAAYARAGFHREFMRGKITLIGCPKLDGVDYSEKLAGIISNNDIRSLTVARMEVPCCGGIERAAAAAAETAESAGKPIPLRVVTLGTDGSIRNDSGALSRSADGKTGEIKEARIC
jgi:NAD-dependent dihydropyrimidine dehydrogenase PreA subunit